MRARDSAGSSRAAAAARSGSFTSRRWPITQTSTVRTLGRRGAAGRGADWWITVSRPRSRGGTLRHARSFSATSRSASAIARRVGAGSSARYW